MLASYINICSLSLEIKRESRVINPLGNNLFSSFLFCVYQLMILLEVRDGESEGEEEPIQYWKPMPGFSILQARLRSEIHSFYRIRH
jgi:hypothetical protein